MSLMESMRSGTDSTFMQLMLAVVVISFIGWGAGRRDNLGDVKAMVNGEPITMAEFGKALRSEEARRRERSKEALTEDQRAEMSESVLQDLVRRKAMLQEAARLGIEVSDAEIANLLLDDPSFRAFRDKDGNFNEEYYENILRSNRMSRAAFEEGLREDLTLQKLADLLTLSAAVPEASVRSAFIDENTKVELEVVRIRPNAFLASIEPSDEEVSTWAQENDAAVRARYEKDFERLYNQKEQVRLSVIRLALKDDGLGVADLKPRLDQIRAELDGGGDFATLARRWSEDPSAANGGSLQAQVVTDLDKETADAVRDLAAGQLAPLVIGSRDLKIVRLDERVPAKVVTLEEVRGEIAKGLLRDQQAPKKAREFAETVLLPKWQESGTAPEAELEPYKLRVTPTGAIAVGGASGGLLRPPADLLAAARTAEPGAVLPTVYEDGDVLWVAKLVSRTEADQAEFDEGKERYQEMALEKRRSELLDAWRSAIVAKAVITQ
ncbi:MAG TPA: SurA N-terminal domain-containing protein [Myxococcota bacterium]|nr:SurA N-terminal domain-containing protein [Myxococcota bacterium]